MDERTALLLQEAFETIERVEREQADRAPEREQRELNELLSDTPVVRRRTSPREDLIYKTTQQPEPKAATMDAATTEGWNKWANGIVQTKLEAFAGILGAEVGSLEKRLLTQFNAEITQLNEKIQQEQLEVKTLRAVIDELRADVIEILRANNAKNVTPLRSANVA